jgi:putative transposase
VGVAVRGHRHDEGASRGKKTGPNPTDRGKSGTKRSILVEGNGVPLAIEIAGANRHDMKLAGSTLQNVVVERPRPTKKHPQNVCMDKGYDFPAVDELVAEWGCTANIARKGVDQSKIERIPGYRSRRWVVERTHSWMNRFRRLLIRWEKKKKNYLAMIHFACAWITYQQTGIFG